MAEKKKQQTNSSSLIPGDTPANSIRTVGEKLHAELMRVIEGPTAASKKKKKTPPSVSKKSGSSMNEPPSVHPPKTQRTARELQCAKYLRTARELQRAKDLRVIEALRAANEMINTPPSNESPSVDPQKTQSSVSPSDSVRSDSSSFIPSPRTLYLQSQLCVVSPRRFGKNDWSVLEPPDSHLQKTKCESLQETYSTASTVSVRSESSMYEPPSFHLQRGQSERETDSVISSVSMRSASSMYEPPSFSLKRKQSQLTEEISSCSVCEEAVKDPVRLLCGHWSCKQCVHSFKDKNGADCSCKACGRRSETDQDLQSVLLQKKIKRCEMETEKLQAEKETFQAEKDKFQAEKEKFQAEKETFELEKRKLALEIQLLEQKGSYTN